MKKRPLICVVAADCGRERPTSATVNGIIRQAEVCGCDVAVLTSLCIFNHPGRTKHREEEKRIYDLILSPDFDGYIYCRSSAEMDSATISSTEALLRSTNRYVMVADGSEGESFDYTQSDDFDSFKSIVDHLTEVHGYRRIYCLTGTKGQYQSEERLKGFLRSMRDHGLPCGADTYSYGDFWKKSPSELAARILSGEMEKPEAVVCGNDTMAYKLIEELEKGGIRVPEDMAVTGYDGIEHNSRLFVPLTSYRRDNFQLGADCMRRLYRYITGKVCKRVSGGGNGFIQGTSCGCTRIERVRGKERRSEIVSERFRSEMKNSDMLYSLTSAGSTEELFRRADNYTYLIYRMKRLDIFLTEGFISGCAGTSDALSFGRDTLLYPAYRKTAGEKMISGGESFPAHDIRSFFDMRSGRPTACFIAPLHVEERFFGIVSLSFGKEQFGYDDCFRRLAGCLSFALERLLLLSGNERTERQRLIDSSTGLPNTEGLSEYIRSCAPDRRLLLVSCQVSDINRLYARYGGSRTVSMIRDLARRITALLREGEFCCVLSADSLGIVLDSELRSAELFEELRRTALSAQSAPLGYTFGECSFTPDSISGSDGIYDVIGAAASNPVRTYRFRNTGTRDLYERLTDLRSEMEAHPEKQWSTEDICASLHISKSTLQKNYRSCFGRSVIDELIDFRMAKAKQLLSTTTLTVAEIAAQCGYSTDSYFMKQFKRSTGTTPSEFRRKNDLT